MYARYVPPPKGAAKSPEPEYTVEPSSNPPAKPQPTVYARYVPPPKLTNDQANRQQPSQPQHVHFEADNLDEPPAKKPKIANTDKSSKEPKQKSKKQKKAKKDTQSSIKYLETTDKEQSTAKPVTEDVISNDGEPADLDEPDQQDAGEHIPDQVPEAVESTKKEKKEKKKSKRKGEADGHSEVNDKITARHRSVLEKAAKSIQRPDPQPLADGEDVSMQDAPEVNGNAEPQVGDGMDVDADVPEVHGLEPLPQPTPIVQDTTKPSYETLPSWLAKPIRVSPQATAPFTEFGLSPELGITPEIAEKLATTGYKEAFAIQTAVLPLLLPHHDKSFHGDILVSAATGSGKTLAYTLPIVRDLSLGNRNVTRLRAVVVLPTRELVRQVQQVCQQCAGVFSLNGSKRRVRIGISMGSQPFDQEQTTLVEREERHDPEAYAKRNKRLASESGYGSGEESDEGYNTEDEEKAAIRKREDKIKTLPDHVISYSSKVDILICTPGRLVEHIKYTPGFSLDFVRWLVVDEADKLLGQQFQQWLDVVIPRLQINDKNSRNHKQSNLSGVRKVVLSATMTRDLDRLEGLKLRSPKLIVLEGSGATSKPEATTVQADLALPELLEEAALKVSDPNLKPLFLLDLLQSKYIFALPNLSKASQDQLDDDTSSSESDSDSDSDLETSFKPSRVSADKPSILIFTKSNETALRLSRLLSLLSPTLASLVGTLTSTTQYATRRRTIRSFVAGKLRILVASDLVARGIDLPELDHVVNYDMPSSVASYVHRVGRTARAGKTGRAWTLFTNPEARWFWNEVASENAIQRSKKVERIRVTEEKEEEFEEKVKRYEDALAKLGEEAGEARGKMRAKSQDV